MKYIIDFHNHVSEQDIEQFLTDNNITLLKQLESFGKVYLVESETAVVSNELIENTSLDTEQGIELLSFSIDLVDNYVETSFDIEDEKNWWKVAAASSIDFDQQIHTHKIRGVNSTVYIVDSGINELHPEFATANIELLHTFNGNFTDNNGHGTGLSSLIVGPTCGLANPKLKVVKLFDNTQPTYQSDMLIALDVILNDFIAGGKKASVVNMSWAIPKNEYVNNKIQFMIDQGMYVVAAAGNNGASITDVTPASIPDVLTIGSFNQNLEPSSFSNYTGGSDISYTTNDVNYGALDGWAPGELIWAANKNGGYGYIAGTSAAAAIASAALAYNMDSIIYPEGTLNTASIFPEFMSSFTLIRYGLLDLSDIKYSNSINAAVTYDSTTNPIEGIKVFSLQVTALRETTYKITNTKKTKTLFGETLPEYVTIDNLGYITITHPEIDVPLINIEPIEITAINRLDNSSSTLIINIIVLQQGYDDVEILLSENPEYFENNQELKYNLLDDGCCFFFSGSCQDTGECELKGGSCIGSDTKSCGCVGFFC